MYTGGDETVPSDFHVNSLGRLFASPSRFVPTLCRVVTLDGGCSGGLTGGIVGGSLFFLRAQQYFPVFPADTAGGDYLKIDRLRSIDIVAPGNLQGEAIFIGTELGGEGHAGRGLDGRPLIGVGATAVGPKLFAFVDGCPACGIRFPFRLPATF